MATVKIGDSNGLMPSEQLDNKEGAMFNIRTRHSVDVTLWPLEEPGVVLKGQYTRLKLVMLLESYVISLILPYTTASCTNRSVR